MASRSKRINQSQCSTTVLAFGWFFCFCFLLRQPSFHWIISDGVVTESEEMETFWFFRLRFRQAYDSAYDSDFRFSLGHKLFYYSIASEKPAFSLTRDTTTSDTKESEFDAQHPKSAGKSNFVFSLIVLIGWVTYIQVPVFEPSLDNIWKRSIRFTETTVLFFFSQIAFTVWPDKRLSCIIGL